MAAPALLLTMRLLQGFSLGGEFTGSTVYTTEQASPAMRGLISSSTAAGTTIGFILGSGSAWLVIALLSIDKVARWGPIPFLASVSVVVFVRLLRRGDPGDRGSAQGRGGASATAALAGGRLAAHRDDVRHRRDDRRRTISRSRMLWNGARA